MSELERKHTLETPAGFPGLEGAEYPALALDDARDDHHLAGHQ